MAEDKTSVTPWHEEHLRLAVEAACVALWSWHVEDDRFAMDERGFDLWGIRWRERVTFEELSANIHPADRDRVRAAFNATRSVPGSMRSTSASWLMTVCAGYPLVAEAPTRASSKG